MPDTTIRHENAADIEAIHHLTELAFRGKPYAGGDEQQVIDRLRGNGDLTLSLVSLSNENLVGHIAFSPAVAADNSGPWLALGPVSVSPEFQGKGLGSQLIREGLDQIEKWGALGCILTGNPDFYHRFGFEFSADNVRAGESKDYFMLKSFSDVKPKGPVAFNRAFYESS